MNLPDLVATDHNGTIYIYDSGNKYIRIVDPATKIMRTMIHGSCRLDYMTSMPRTRDPFGLKLKPMICFKKWIKSVGDPTEHIVVFPSKIEVVEPSNVVDGYDDGGLISTNL